ncbi:unnamed protein product [Vitrella brassicaformis CCMP3155]|uniref:TLDc domain-containing protein n=1 Tax=Vitrella brassicaformis (strain CCMP3155) TaxID=1169540 RepID=A0A0G4G0B4_VITBC|nr:unnamed protein product [Vitrella brassicaformis CCMP3155]|eukprot:CEM21134.1 unnamed protein product [Vitrella brassicaformis CCMP3155]
MSSIRALILSSMWSVLEIQSIIQLTVVLSDPFHLDELKAARVRRFAPGRMVHGQMRRAAFALSSMADLLEATLMRTERPHQRQLMNTNLAATVALLSRYLPWLPPKVSADALAIDFAGCMRAAAPMSVVDASNASRRLKAPLMAAMERHGLAMERLHGDGPCIPSPSVIASASQLVAVLRKTGTRIQLLFKATVHGFAYTDMLCRVGHATPLLFLIRANGDVDLGVVYMDGFYINTSLQPAAPRLVESPEARGP